jgi:hypothetical protein
MRRFEWLRRAAAGDLAAETPRQHGASEEFRRLNACGPQLFPALKKITSRTELTRIDQVQESFICRRR